MPIEQIPLQMIFNRGLRTMLFVNDSLYAGLNNIRNTMLQIHMRMQMNAHYVIRLIDWTTIFTIYYKLYNYLH